MVFTTAIRTSRIPPGHPRGPDRIWRRRKILRMSTHFYGRRKNCYKVAIAYVEKAWQYVTKSRKVKKDVMQKLWIDRMTAACEEHGVDINSFRYSLVKMDILLNKKVLSELAIWEPRTFKSLADLTRSFANEQGINAIKSVESSSPGVFTRSMLRNKDNAM